MSNSQLVQAADRDDAALNVIRAQLRQKSDGLPILLLPVRIETRFMTVERPLALGPRDPVRVEAALRELIELNGVGSTLLMSRRSPDAQASELVQRMTRYLDELRSLEELSTRQLGWIRQEARTLAATCATLAKRLKSRDHAELRRELIGTSSRILEWSRAVRSRREMRFDSCRRLVREAQRIATLIRTAAGPQIPFATHSRHRLARYLNAALDDVYDFYSRSNRTWLTIGAIDEVQLELLAGAHRAARRAIDSFVPTFEANLKEVRKRHRQRSAREWARTRHANRRPTSRTRLLRLKQLARAWRQRNRWQASGAYRQLSQRLSARIQGMLLPVMDRFETETLPALRWLSERAVTTVEEIQVQALRTIRTARIVVTALMSDDIDPFLATRARSRDRLERGLTRLDALVTSDLVLGDEVTMGRLRQTLGALETDLTEMRRAVDRPHRHELDASEPVLALRRIAKAVPETQRRSRRLREVKGPSAIAGAHGSLTFERDFVAAAAGLHRELTRLPAEDRSSGEGAQRVRVTLHELLHAARRNERLRSVLSRPAAKRVQAALRGLQESVDALPDADAQGLGNVLMQIRESWSRHVGLHQTWDDAPGPVLVQAMETVNELWVRIFPDNIAIETHEEKLTVDETEAGRDYWTAVWAASEHRTMQTAAWRHLSARVGTSRAAWIVRTLRPDLELSNFPSAGAVQALNDLDGINDLLGPLRSSVSVANGLQPIVDSNDGQVILTKLTSSVAALNAGQIEQEGFVALLQSALLRLERDVLRANEHRNALSNAMKSFVDGLNSGFASLQQRIADLRPVTTTELVAAHELPFAISAPDQKQHDWTEPAKCRVLPERLVVLTRKGSKWTHAKVCRPIDQGTVNVGPDPSIAAQHFKRNDHGDLEVDPGMKWMVDFDQAVQRGLGIRLRLTADQALSGFDELYVIGVRDVDENSGQALLESLLTSHHFSPKGMSLVPVGTPTNNTTESDSGYSSADEDPELTFELEQGPTQFTVGGDPDRISDGQRLADALGVAPSVFQRTRHAGFSEISDGLTFHRALYGATLGYHLEHLLGRVFTPDTFGAIRSFFVKFCRARGPLPTLRAGAQPYAVIPTTAYTRFEPTASSIAGDQEFVGHLTSVLQALIRVWSNVRNEHVPHLYNRGTADPQQHFMDILALHPYSVTNYYRYASNVARRGMPDPEYEFGLDFTSTAPFSPSRFWQWFRDHLGTTALDEDVAGVPFDTYLAESLLYRMRYFSDHEELAGPRVTTLSGANGSTVELLSDQHGLPSVDTYPGTYIGWLLERSPIAIHSQNDPAQLPSTALLFALLRHSLLLAYNDAAFSILEREKIIPPLPHRHEIMANGHYGLNRGGSPYYRYFSHWSYLFLTVDDIANVHDPRSDRLWHYMRDRGASMADFLHPAHGNSLRGNYPGLGHHGQALDRLEAVKADIAALERMTTLELSRLLSGHLDAVTYRLDAWLTGLATARLEDLRYGQQRSGTNVRPGVYLGAFGWIERLEPGKPREEAIDVRNELKGPPEDPVYRDHDLDGFLHAPSLNHAIAGAVLRNGFLSRARGVENVRNSLAVNLSSARVRRAKSLLDGVRAGLEPGAVLGTHLERGLHEHHRDVELDKYIRPLRERFSTQLPVTDDHTPSQIAAEGNVVDAAALLADVMAAVETVDFDRSDTLFDMLFDGGSFAHCPMWLKQMVWDLNGGTMTPQADKELVAILREIDAVADTSDALADVLNTETIYQLVRGNSARAAAVSQALADGRAPPDPQVLDTPRTGTAVTHRVALLLDPTSVAQLEAGVGRPAGWESLEPTPRALSEPSLNHWLGRLIGSPADIAVGVESVGGPTVVLQLEDLGLQPLDLLAVAGDREAGRGRLVRYVEHIARRTEGWSDDVAVKVHLGPDGQSADPGRSLLELLPLLAQVRTLVSDAKPLSARDVILPDDSSANGVPFAAGELKARVDAARTALHDLIDDVEQELAPLLDAEPEAVTTPELDALRALLERAFLFGVENTVPVSSVGANVESVKALSMQLRLALDELRRRAQTADQEWAEVEAGDEATRVEASTQVARTLFGRAHVVVAHHEQLSRQAWTAQLSRSHEEGLLRHHGKSAMTDWLSSVARVRPRLGALRSVRVLAALEHRPVPALVPGQFPYAADHSDYWLGLEYPSSHTPEGDKLSIVLIGPHLASRQVVAGILIDEWTEVIPSKEETTGVAFNYDAPDSRAPQACLLAVSPTLTGKWSWDDLVQTLVDTLEVARNRAVEPDQLEDTPLAQLLPAVNAEILPESNRTAVEDNRRVVVDFRDNQPPPGS